MKDTSKLLLKASFVGTFAETMLVPVWATLTNRVGGSILDAGIGYAFFSIITGIVVISAGRSNWYRKNVRMMVFGGFLIAGIGDLLYIGVHRPWQLFLVQSIVGLAIGILNPAWNSLYNDLEKGDGTKKWCFSTGGASLVTGFAAVTGGYMVSRFGFVWLFIAMALLDCFSVYFAWKVWKHRDSLIDEAPIKIKPDDICEVMDGINAIARETGMAVAFHTHLMVQTRACDAEHREGTDERNGVPIKIDLSARRKVLASQPRIGATY